MCRTINSTHFRGAMQAYSPRLLGQLWCRLPGRDLKMMLVILEARPPPLANICARILGILLAVFSCFGAVAFIPRGMDVPW